MSGNIGFRGTFRPYQQRVLERAGEYLKDGKLHIVAAPGSGKTVLGLELILRCGGNALILSPNLVIRDQWIERFLALFTDGGQESAVSSDWRNLKAINSFTYQSLYRAMSHAEGNGAEGVKDCLRAVRQAEIAVVCLDEAHHLRSEWQRALEQFLDALKGSVTVISLTATPPYDSTPAEWARYLAVCGEIDEEIFVPELVQGGALCPHQDYILTTVPEKSEAQPFERYRANADAALRELEASRLTADLLRETLCKEADEQRDELLWDRPEWMAAALAYLKQVGIKPPKSRIAMLGTRRLPEVDASLLERLYDGILNGEPLFSPESVRPIRAVLSRYGLIERGRVRLTCSASLQGLLTESAAKLRGALRIAKCEYAALGDSLRMVALADYIRPEAGGAVKLGVMPLFWTLSEGMPSGFRIGVITGRTAVLPQSVAVRHGLAYRQPDGRGCCEVWLEGGNAERVGFMSRLLKGGEIHCLIGTKALLGEGWDSPCVNTLLLCSDVGSYVSSNQMRGRAIRIDPDQPGKVANIWHIVAVEPLPEEEGETAFSAESDDLSTLRRRFDAFPGLRWDGSDVESGITRTGFPCEIRSFRQLEAVNRSMLARAKDREAVREGWRSMVDCGRTEIVCRTSAKRKPVSAAFALRLARRELGWRAALAGVGAALCLAAVFVRWLLAPGALYLLAGLILLFETFKRSGMILRPRRTLERAARALICALKRERILSERAELVTGEEGEELFFSVVRAEMREKEQFAAAFEEMFSPIVNPRYVLILRGYFGRDYRNSYTVPACFSGSRAQADAFCSAVKSQFHAAEAVYTRGEDGKKVLSRCRREAFVNGNQMLCGTRRALRKSKGGKPSDKRNKRT